MKKRVLTLTATLLCVCLLCGCTNTTENTDKQDEKESTPLVVDFNKTDEEMFTDRDLRATYDTDEAVTVSLNGNSASASSDSVKIVGTTVQITEEGVYVFSGTLDDGQIVVSADKKDKVQLVLNGCGVTSSTSAALYIEKADKVFLTLCENTENTLANGGEYVNDTDVNIDGAVFSKADLTVNGTGKLTVTSPTGHGIVCKDDLVLAGGDITVVCASHGLQVNDSVRVTGSTELTVDAGKDGVHVENEDDTTKGYVYIADGTLILEAEGDGIDASLTVQMNGGTLTVTAGGGYQNSTKTHTDDFGGFGGGGFGGGGRPGGQNNNQSSSTSTADVVSMKGVKATGGILFNGGTVTMDCADDTVHSNGTVTINGGTFTLASGDDGIHADDTLTVTGGSVTVTTCYEGYEALHIVVSGGDTVLKATDDGLNAAGGSDNSGTTGGRDGMFGGGGFGGGMGGGMGGSSSNGTMVISGGTLYINASGDGLDANGTIEISGGYTVVVGPTTGDTSTIDYDTSGIITGGTFIGSGASSMAETFSDSTQGVVAVSVGTREAGTKISLADANGNVLLSAEPELPFQVVYLSCPEMVKGQSYTVTVGSSQGSITAK